jgi:hypothetical protein
MRPRDVIIAFSGMQTNGILAFSERQTKQGVDLLRAKRRCYTRFQWKANKK